MKLIRLHLVSNNEEIFLNKKKIIYFHKYAQDKNGSHTRIKYGRGKYAHIYVSKSVEEICKLLCIN